MNFSISDEQYEMLEHLDRFCEENLHELEIQEWIAEGGVPDSFMLKYYQEGFSAIGFPEKMGGKNTSMLTRTLMLERLALHAGATLPIQSLMNYAHIVSDVANDEQMAIMRNIMETTGKPGFSLAATEPHSGSDSLDVQTVAIEDEDGFVINGVKSFVSLGQYAPYIVLTARDEEIGLTADGKAKLTFFFLPRDTEGIDIIPINKIGQRLVPTAEIILKDVHVPHDSIMGKRGEAARPLLSSYDYGRVYVCATSIGLAQATFKQALSFSEDRSASGKPILAHQQVQEMVTDMQVSIDAMRALLYKTAYSFDEKEKDQRRMDAALLKRFVPRTATKVADNAIQIMGSMGYVTTAKAGRIWEECRGNQIAEGTDQIMTLIASKRINQRMQEEKERPPVWRF